MKKVIWGTGLYARRLMYTMKKEEIDFFIDNNKKKRGQFFFEKKILNPDEVKNWDELYIYIPFNFYDDITNQLKRYGINDSSHYQKYYDINKMKVAKFIRDYESALTSLKQYEKRMKGFCLFWGRAWALEDRGYEEYIREWVKNNDNLKWGLVSEAIWCSREETEKFMSMPAIVTPVIFDESIYIENGLLEKNQMIFLKKKKYAYKVMNCLKAKFPSLTEMGAYYMVYYMYHYANELLDRFQPKQIILYALLSVQHLIVEEVCKEKKIPLITTHPGVLSGTLSFDVGGEMGKSLPALYPEKFKNLPVSSGEIEYAQKVWDYLYNSKLNRRIQPKNNCLEFIKKNIDKDRPIVFFAGQNDINSNMVPYTAETKKYHSPIFHTSIDAGTYLAKLCKKNSWNFIYKPHPMSTKYDSKEQLPDNTIYIDFGDINDLIDISDVVVTILSQTNYISLIRYKPVVMLGFNQTKGKGCTYEAFKLSEIEKTIIIALNNGFTKQQQKAFLIHIAQLIKYYLYDDLQEREFRFGQRPSKCINQFYELEKMLKI